jgi:hypothetical protein
MEGRGGEHIAAQSSASYSSTEHHTIPLPQHITSLYTTPIPHEIFPSIEGGHADGLTSGLYEAWVLVPEDGRLVYVDGLKLVRVWGLR